MPKHTLFICKSCHHSAEERPEGEAADGQVLLDRVLTLAAETLPSDDIEIQSVSCLWMCDKPCAAAFSAPHKSTYLFTNLPTDETAAALLEFGKLYLSSKAGDIPWKQSPEMLQSVSIAKIPAVGMEG